MGFYTNPDQPPVRPSRFRLFLFLLLVYFCVKVFGGMHWHPFRLPSIPATSQQRIVRHETLPPIVPVLSIGDAASPGLRNNQLNGRRVWGNGTNIDLGDRRTHLPGSLMSKFFPDPMILASCLTDPPPVSGAATGQKLLPVRDDWPGFYGAPWVARMDGNLIVLLDVYAPRHSAKPVPEPQFQFYIDYTSASVAALSFPAPAAFYRGSKAVLYRVYLNGGAANNPFRCLDLVVQNGQNNGIGHLYYQKYHHYYETDASFVIQQ